LSILSHAYHIGFITGSEVSITDRLGPVKIAKPRPMTILAVFGIAIK